jgi:putative GTP pyrophosphokinase
MAKKDIDDAVKWYEKHQHLYRALAIKVELIVKENLDQKGIVYHSVTCRSKDRKSFADKAAKDKYSHPTAQIKDMAGVRVITYLESDVQKVASVIEELFKIDKEDSLDQSKLLGNDRVGYRSVHYVAKFDSARCEIPEFKPYAGLPFEIQIRSLLQHAWAEIEHDRNYKFSGKLPSELGRRFFLVAGILEVADREFVEIASEIDRYKADVKEDIAKHELDIEINSVSLTEYLSKKFASLIEAGAVDSMFGLTELSGRGIVNELELFGILRLSQLDQAIPTGLEDKIALLQWRFNLSGIVRAIMMISDFKKYLTVSWQGQWNLLDPATEKLLKEYDIDTKYIVDYVRKRN